MHAPLETFVNGPNRTNVLIHEISRSSLWNWNMIFSFLSAEILRNLDTTVLIHGCTVLLTRHTSSPTRVASSKRSKSQAKCTSVPTRPTRANGDPISENYPSLPLSGQEDRQRRSHAAADLDNLWQSWRIGGGDGWRRREREKVREEEEEAKQSDKKRERDRESGSEGSAEMKEEERVG